MKLTLNGQPTELAEATTVGQLVDRLVQPRSRWDATPLAPGDRVELLTVAQGG